VFLALEDSTEVLKLYKYIFNIHRLVDPPLWKLLSRGKYKMQMGRLVNISPYYGQGGGVEWQDPVNLATARIPSLPVVERGESGNFKQVKRPQ